MGISLGSLAARFDCELVGDADAEVTHVATLANAGPGALSFLANPAYRDQLADTQASAVLLKAEHAEHSPVSVLVSDDPYLSFARIARELHPVPERPPGVHPSAVVDPGAKIADSAYVGPLAFVGEAAEVAANAHVGPGCVVGERCVVGESSRLIANVTLVQDVRIGMRTIVHPGAVLGSDGFGNARSESGWVKVPQVGGVRIGDDVEIGANTTIDRGAIDDTIIDSGVRLDNLIQIAHNVRIGEHTAIAATAGISGSTTIGKRCMLAGRVGIVGHVSVCDDVIITGAAVVTKDITEPGVYSASFAAEKDSEWKRRVIKFKRLDKLLDRVSMLEERLEKLSDKPVDRNE